MSQKIPAALGQLCGIATIGPRGQVVIPKDVRDKLHLKAGERFLVLEHFGKIVFIPEKMMRQMVGELTKFLK